jgi:hypothetical protein
LKDERRTSTRKNIRFDNELLKKIESELNGKPFSEWVQDACKLSVHTTDNIGTHHQEKKPSNTPPKPKTIPPSKNDGYAAKHGLPRNITEELHIKIMELSKQGLSGNKIADILPASKATINRVINISK